MRTRKETVIDFHQNKIIKCLSGTASIPIIISKILISPIFLVLLKLVVKLTNHMKKERLKRERCTSQTKEHR